MADQTPFEGPGAPTSEPLDALDLIPLGLALRARAGEDGAVAADIAAVAAEQEVPESHVLTAVPLAGGLALKREHPTCVQVCVGGCQRWGAVALLDDLLTLRTQTSAAFDISPRACLDHCESPPMVRADTPHGLAAFPRADAQTLRDALKELLEL